MKRSRWSPADLDRQQLVVQRMTRQCELDLLALAGARTRMVATVQRQIGIPLALAGCFVAGMIAVPGSAPPREPGTQLQRARRLRQGAILFRTIVLALTGPNALIRFNRRRDTTVDSA